MDIEASVTNASNLSFILQKNSLQVDTNWGLLLNYANFNIFLSLFSKLQGFIVIHI